MTLLLFGHTVNRDLAGSSNTKLESIKFTVEQKKEGAIPFLDVSINERLKTSVHRKKTHTDRYLHFSSNHHPQTETGIISCLQDRAEKCVIKHPWQTPWRGFRYPRNLTQCVLKKRNCRREHDAHQPQERSKTHCLPCMKGVSEQVQWMCQWIGTKTIFSASSHWGACSLGRKASPDRACQRCGVQSPIRMWWNVHRHIDR